MFFGFVLVAAAFLSLPSAQSKRGTENGEWRYLGGDVGHTRYSPLDQVTPANFETLKEAWLQRKTSCALASTARARKSVTASLMS